MNEKDARTTREAKEDQLKILEQQMNTVLGELAEMDESEETLNLEGKVLVSRSPSQTNYANKETELQSRTLAVGQNKNLILNQELGTDYFLFSDSNNIFHEVDKFPFYSSDVLQHEKMADEEEMPMDEGMQTFEGDSENEVDWFLGCNPVEAEEELKLRADIINRIKFWIKDGIGKKEEKEKLIASIPTRGALNLVAPLLNEEITVDIYPKVLSRDEYFRNYQNLAGASLAGVSSVFSAILDDADTPLDRDFVLKNLSNSVKLLSELFSALTQSRKTFLVGKYEERIQKILKKSRTNKFFIRQQFKISDRDVKGHGKSIEGIKIET